MEWFEVEAPFSTDVPVGGFRLGMTRTDARLLIERLGMSGAAALIEAEQRWLDGEKPDPRPVWSSGVDEDGHELTVKVGERVSSIRRYMPGYRDHEVRRSERGRELFAREKARRARAEAWKQIIDDDDRMLDDWAAHCSPWNDYSPAEFVKFAQWLKQAGPDEWHAAAQWWNWDYGFAPLLWIVRRPDCDLATALFVLFGCGPYHYIRQVDSDGRLIGRVSDPDAVALMLEVKERIDRGFYTRSSIRFDASSCLDLFEREQPTSPQRAALLPKGVRRLYDGRRIERANNFGGIRHPGFVID